MNNKDLTKRVEEMGIKIVRMPLEEEYTRLYGKALVRDLHWAFRGMEKSMECQKRRISDEDVLRLRRGQRHEYGDWKTVYYVDFIHQCLYSQTRDEWGNKTICPFGDVQMLHGENALRYLLSGLFIFDKAKAVAWAEKIFGPGEKIWYEVA